MCTNGYRFRTQTFNYNDKGKQLKLFFFSLLFLNEISCCSVVYFMWIELHTHSEKIDSMNFFIYFFFDFKKKCAQTAHIDAPPPSQPASSLGGPPTTTSTPIGTTPGLLLLVGVASGTTLVLLNIVLIGCCLHRRTQNRIKRGKWRDVMKLRVVKMIYC